MTYSLDRIGYKNKYPIVSIGMTSSLYLFCLILLGLIAVEILNKRAYITFFYKSISYKEPLLQSFYCNGLFVITQKVILLKMIFFLITSFKVIILKVIRKNKIVLEFMHI
jgi:hypothetical protein